MKTTLPRRRTKTATTKPATIHSLKGTKMKDSADNKTMELPIDMVESTNSSAVWPQLDIPTNVDPMLVTILSWPRSHNTLHEIQFGQWLTGRLTQMGHKPMLRAEGALTVEIVSKSGELATTLFSCHIDTVDPMVSDTQARKKLTYDPNFGQITLDKDNTVGTCLGADDGVGVWIMLKMIEAGIPGGYIFNRGEERGGISAKAMAAKEAVWLKKFQVAVSFDRPHDYEVITHQRGGTECASTKFALALCAAINKAQPAFDYKPSKAGVYTDTFDWRGLIAECINLGVGYTDQHGKSEVQDYAHAVALLEVCKTINWEALPVDREPKIEQVYSGFKGFDKDYDTWTGGYVKKAKPKLPPAPQAKAWTPPAEPDMPIEDAVLMIGDVREICYWLESEADTAAYTVVKVCAELRGMRAELAALRAALTTI